MDTFRTTGPPDVLHFLLWPLERELGMDLQLCCSVNVLTEYHDGSKHPPHKTGHHQQWRLAWQAGQLHAHLMGTSGRFWSPGMVPISRRPQESPRKLESASSERETAVIKRTCFTERGHQGRVEFRQKNLSHKPDVPANARNPRSYGV